MIPMTLREIADVVGGVVVGDGAIEVTGPASVDSRLVEVGGLFIAFVGEYADGHEFAETAVASGAAAVMGARDCGVAGVVVDDPMEALARLATHVAASLNDTLIIAVTGSQGKTSTKDLLAQMLSAHGSTVATHGSFNNELGLPLTVLRADLDTRYLVLEMGARGRGHLADLCEIAQPDVSVVLNVGKAHIGEFGDQESIAATKAEIVEALDDTGVAVLNADDPLVAAMADKTGARVTTFGEADSADIRVAAVDLDELGRPTFDLSVRGETVSVSLRLIGEHQAINAAAAVATALAVGVPLAQAVDSLEQVRSLSKWRMEVHERADGLTLINDAYNANPDSMRAALKSLASIGRKRQCRTVAVLSEMRELGESSREEHDAIGRLAVRLDIGQLLVIGEPARALHLGACLEGSWGEESVFVRDKSEAAEWLRSNLVATDVVLLKASRGAGLEELADVILEQSGDRP